MGQQQKMMLNLRQPRPASWPGHDFVRLRRDSAKVAAGIYRKPVTRRRSQFPKRPCYGGGLATGTAAQNRSLG
jgi:hypothetical protein